MTAVTEIATTATIVKTSEVDGRDGPQWELELRWPWTNPQYVDKVWLSKKDYQAAPARGAQNVIAIKTGNKKKRDGTYYDGSQPWQCNYRILSFGGPGVQTSTPPAANATAATTARPGANYSDPRQASIERQVAFKAAVDLLIANVIQLSPDQHVDDALYWWTDRFVGILANRPELDTPFGGPVGDEAPYCARHRVSYAWVVNERTGQAAWAHLDGTHWCIQPVDELQP